MQHNESITVKIQHALNETAVS